MAGTTPLRLGANKDYTLLLLLLVAFAADGARALLLAVSYTHLTLPTT